MKSCQRSMKTAVLGLCGHDLAPEVWTLEGRRSPNEHYSGKKPGSTVGEIHDHPQVSQNEG